MFTGVLSLPAHSVYGILAIYKLVITPFESNVGVAIHPIEPEYTFHLILGLFNIAVLYGFIILGSFTSIYLLFVDSAASDPIIRSASLVKFCNPSIDFV